VLQGSKTVAWNDKVVIQQHKRELIAVAGYTVAELRALPAQLKPEEAFRAIGFGRTKGYALIRSGEFPARVLRFGGSYRIVTADLLRVLGVEPEPGEAKAL
jgi:hypothetical protein